ncbi:MAG: hypothetical protein QXT14_06035 [Candidatus Bathyarchaeia archaeon]
MSYSIPRKNAYVNVARYGESWVKPRELGVLWSDPRDVYAVVVRFKSPPSDLKGEDVRLQYWQCHWPRFREAVGAGFSGWSPIDDFYNGQWRDAEFYLDTNGPVWTFKFKPVSVEFPEVKDYDVEYRRTLKIRLVSSKDLPEVESFEVYTDSTWKIMDVSIEWGCGGDCERTWDGFIEVFNGELAGLKPLSNSRVEVVSENSWRSKVERDETGGVEARIWYTHSNKADSFDETIVTVRSKAFSFSFSMRDLEREEAIFIGDYDVLISKTSKKLKLEAYKRELSEKGLASIYDLIGKMPEQTLERAWREMPKKKKSIHFIVGCKGRRQKFGVDTKGVVFIPKLWNVRVKGRYSDRFLWEGDTVAYGFGLPDSEPEERTLEEGFLPIVRAKWVEDGIVYEQEVFATLLFKDALDDLKGEEFIDGDDPIVCMVRLTFTSQALSRKSLSLKFTSTCKSYWRDVKGVEEQLIYEDGFIYALYPEKAPSRRLRYMLDLRGRGDVKSLDGSLIYTVDINPGESHNIYVKIPSITLLESFEFEKLKSLDYEAEKAKIVKYWRSLLGRGMQIHVPDRWLNDFYKAYLSHVYITDDKEPNSQRYMCRVSSFNYGVFANESAMVISELDRRGLHDEAERRLEVFTHYQGTAVMAGRYSTSKGVFYGAGGYECGEYGQHHGWVLWAFAEHYRYTGDKEWLKRVASNLVEACNWIIEERKATMKTDANGKRVIEYGFLPPGSLEDVTEFWCWIATNAHAYRGLKSAAEVLSEIDHPEASRLKREAEAYGRDILNGVMEAMIRSPVVKLRDGTWIPHIPSRPERRGRDSGWIRETLEGAMHLIICSLVDPNSKTAEWILKDYEDNRYISDKYGYTVPDLDRHWFSRGGFSMQPNLYGFQIPYLLRMDVKRFLRAFFNSFAVAFYPDVLMLTEHPLPTMADWAGDHFKTSDESIACQCLRLMLIYEKGDTLILMPAVPRKWLEDGKQISVRDAATYFGPISFEVESKPSDGFIRMKLNPPTRKTPKSIQVYFRHPIEKVELDGREWTDYSGEEGLVNISTVERPVELVVYVSHSAR